ncbi:MAG: DM13 domain-containing protein [Nitrososphaerales archaeon]
MESTPKYQLTRHVAQNKPYLLLVHEVDENVAGMSEQEAGPAAINVLSSGSFVGVGGHAADGVASILSVNGEEYLRFEQFMVTNGPDLHVYLTTGGDVQKGIDLGKLKGSKGDQNYLLNNIDKMNYDTVVIYCQPFHVVFGTAGLT